MIIKCVLCNNLFNGGNRGKYCIKCREKVCQYCGKKYTINYGGIKRIKSSRYCSLSCHAKVVFSNPELQAKIIHPSGKNHHNFKGGTINKERGYKIIYAGKKQVYEHRYIMEQYLGRKLCFNETIHHINGNKLDNRIENLEVIDRSSHTHKYHMRGINR